MPTVYDSDEEEQIKDDMEGRDIPFDDITREKAQQKKDKKDMSDIDKLKHRLKSAKRILLKVRAVFPFDFFPNEIIVDENKVDVVVHTFFLSKETFSIPVDNINAVTSSSNLLFGELRIEAWGIAKLPDPVQYLWKKDAYTARRLISGLLMAHKEGVDITNVPLEEARRTLEDIGRSLEEKQNVKPS